jgi:hypothetical protein
MLRFPHRLDGCRTTLTAFGSRPEIIYGLQKATIGKGDGRYLWDGLPKAHGRTRLRLPSHSPTQKAGEKTLCRAEVIHTFHSANKEKVAKRKSGCDGGIFMPPSPGRHHIRSEVRILPPLLKSVAPCE